MPEAEAAATPSIPLCIDLDGTLVCTDLLHEAVLDLLKSAPLQLTRLPSWLVAGKAHMKQRIAELTDCEALHLPYRQEVLALIHEARAQGRPVVLVTAAAPKIAKAVADHLGLFDLVLSSEGSTNLAAELKARRLVELFGIAGYDYVGNDKADIPVWRNARNAIVVSNRRNLISRAGTPGQQVHHIPDQKSRLRLAVKSLRPHQWVKNLLVFVPLIAGQKVGESHLLWASVLGFAAFSLAASFGYIVNDLLDLRADRKHFRKRERPFASGALSPANGVGLAALLLFGLGLLLIPLPPLFGAVLALYLVLTLSYSLRLKRQVIVDVVLLAGLYTLRIIAGAVVTGIQPSFWLLAMSMFLFLSLAIVKRFSELRLALDKGAHLAGRGYMAADLPVLLALGTGSGLLAVMVLALYLNSVNVLTNYREPLWLWLAPPLALYWVARLWMKTHRGEVHDDPIVFAARDWQSITLAFLLAMLFFAAVAGLRLW